MPIAQLLPGKRYGVKYPLRGFRPAFFEGLNRAYLPTFTGEEGYRLGLGLVRRLGRKNQVPEVEPVTGLARRRDRGERRAQEERAGTGRRGPALREPSGFCHAVAPAEAVIGDVHLVTHFRLVRPCVQFGVRDEDTFGAVAFPLFQGIRQVDVPAADLGLVLSGEGRGPDAYDFHVASCLSSLTGAEGPLPLFFVDAGKPCNHPAVYGLVPRGFLM